MRDFDAELRSIEEKGLLRELNELPRLNGKFTYKEKECINFSSNDYLNLANDPRVKAAAIAAIEKSGSGSTGSRLMGGTLPLHAELEEKLSGWLGQEAALVFGSGFLANLGVISALAKPDDAVFFDRLDHASLIDGIMMSGAAWKRFKHNDVEELEGMLRTSREEGKFIIVDSVFSVDGDVCRIVEINELAKKYGAFLIVDEAHALGVFGNGAGICAEKNIKPGMITGTLSKAFGGYGGFAACAANVKKYLINSARSFIFSTALPPSCAGAGIAALEIIKNTHQLGKNLLLNAEYFHGLLKSAGFNLPQFESQIIPVIIGENEKAMELSALLLEQGLYIKAIRPPTVPAGTARLRISVTLAHSRRDLEIASEKIRAAAKKTGVL